MKAMILAAGLGTRLKPWTNSHPKALVPVDGVPMLERVIRNLETQGFDRILVNVHHFSEQVISFLEEKKFASVIGVSDESGALLDTGGALVRAGDFFYDSAGVLVHNVDILSNADLRRLMEDHYRFNSHGATLLVSDRVSSRKLIFDSHMQLRGWQNVETGEFRPSDFEPNDSDRRYAFSGIHVVSGDVVNEMRRLNGTNAFPVMDYYLSNERKCCVRGQLSKNLRLIDIGKPENLKRAFDLLKQL